MKLRLGDILVSQGLLSEEQRDLVLKEQRETGEPFGSICERRFAVPPDAVEEAWASQYAELTRTVDPRIEPFEDRALELVSRRQAWQFRVLPIRFDGAELMMVTTQRHLPRALRFAVRFIGVPVYFVLADPAALGEAMCKRYPLSGMTPDSIDDAHLERLLKVGTRPVA